MRCWPTLQGERGKLGPPTVYRALDFLLAHKLIHKIESVSAFVACDDVEHPHESQFMICDDCGATEEIQDDAIVETPAPARRGSRLCRRPAGHRGARVVPRLPSGPSLRPGQPKIIDGTAVARRAKMLGPGLHAPVLAIGSLPR